MYTKKEASHLTGMTLQQLDYWGKTVLNIVPEAKGSKYSNVFYTFLQIGELKLAANLKKQGFVNEFIKAFLHAWRTTGRPVDNYVVKLEQIADFQYAGIINVQIQEYQRRKVHSDEEGDFYYIVSHQELMEFINKVHSYDDWKLQILPVPVEKSKEELKKNAEKYEIELKELAA